MPTFTPTEPTYQFNDVTLMTIGDMEDYIQFKLCEFINSVLPDRMLIEAETDSPSPTTPHIAIRLGATGGDGGGTENLPKYKLYDTDEEIEVNVFEHVATFLVVAAKGRANADLNKLKSSFVMYSPARYNTFDSNPTVGYRSCSTVSNSPTVIDLQSWEAGARMTVTLSYLSYLKQESSFGEIEQVGLSTTVKSSDGDELDSKDQVVQYP